MAEYIERKNLPYEDCWPTEFADGFNYCLKLLRELPAADVRPVVTCEKCAHNNACLTQSFVDDCGKVPLDRSTFFCADGERKSNA